MNELEKSIDETIAKAVESKIEAQMVSALANDEMVGKFVVEALQAPVETGRYGETKEPYIRNVLRRSIQNVTEEVVQETINKKRKELEQIIIKEINKKQKKMAANFVDKLCSESFWKYRANIDINFLDEDNK